MEIIGQNLNFQTLARLGMETFDLRKIKRRIFGARPEIKIGAELFDAFPELANCVVLPHQLCEFPFVGVGDLKLEEEGQHVVVTGDFSFELLTS